MSEQYNQLLEATIQHLHELKDRGVRFVPVSAEVLARLGRTSRSAPGFAGSSRQAVRGRNGSSTATRAPSRPTEAQRSAPPEPAATPAPAVAGDKAAVFDSLRQRAVTCVKCPHLVASRRQVVFGVGNIDAQLMFVGEAPGADEDRQGEPFVGAAGQLLNRIIEACGMKREDVYICNIIRSYLR